MTTCSSGQSEAILVLLLLLLAYEPSPGGVRLHGLWFRAGQRICKSALNTRLGLGRSLFLFWVMLEQPVIDSYAEHHTGWQLKRGIDSCQIILYGMVQYLMKMVDLGHLVPGYICSQVLEPGCEGRDGGEDEIPRPWGYLTQVLPKDVLLHYA